jgi:hypothetical protein
MGYVKLKKAGDAFDILSAEGVATIKLQTGTTPDTIDVTYLGSSSLNVTITPVADFVQADVQALNDAIGKIGGGAGLQDVDLSQVVSEIGYA